MCGVFWWVVLAGWKNGVRYSKLGALYECKRRTKRRTTTKQKTHKKLKNQKQPHTQTVNPKGE
ncbi:MAG: hypothetical protein QXR18_08005, partial [Pyrobaculum sp.]